MATVNEYKKIIENLDGKQSISVPMEFRKNGDLISDPLDIIVKGFLKFKDVSPQQGGNESVPTNDSQDKTAVYPVLFSSGTIRINNGKCVIVLLPRSEDLFEETKEVQDRAAVDDDDIPTNVPDDEVLKDDKIPIEIKIEKDKIRDPYKISLQVTVTSVGDTSFYVQTVDRGTNPQIETTSGAASLFQKQTARIPSNLIIDCETDLEWIPSVKSLLTNNAGTQEEVLQQINNLKNATPLGTSTMYDAIIAGDRILSDSAVDNSQKTIYVFTDNEASTSLASIQNVVDETNDIDGDKEVPIMVGNMAISDDAALSVKASRSDTKNINNLSFNTGGQSVTVVDESFLDDIVGIFYRSSVGSMGYGTYEFVKDFGEEVLINRISATFDIPSSDSNATWSIETSLDGYNYTAIDVIYNPTDSVTFENLLVRYIRFKIIMVSGISSSLIDEYGTTPDTPSLDSIEVVFNANKVAYLYLNKEDVDISPYQITLAVDANEINNDQIKVGVAKSDAINWEDFSTESQPVVDQNGKVVIPIRFSQDVEDFEHEPLRKVDNFVLRTKYGRWDQNATVIVYDKNNSPIITDYYELYPREGRVVFNTALPSDYQDGDYKIGILNIGQYKVGLKLTNKTETDTLDVYGVGWEYTTGKDLLPPVSKAAPEVQQVSIISEFPNRFSVIELSYIYFDINFDQEDTTKREITWYINGNPQAALQNLMRWNDITDPTDPVYSETSLKYPTAEELGGLSIEDWSKQQTVSFIKSGDSVYAEIKVSDGELVSDKGASNVVDIVESPPLITSLSVRGKDADGNILTRVTPGNVAIIDPPLEETFFSDGNAENHSEIIWYVNDDVFKRGTYGFISPHNIPITEIHQNETAAGSLIDYGLRIGNKITVQVIPQTPSTTGDMVQSLDVIVDNSIPVVDPESFDFIENVFATINNITLNWVFTDFEIQLLSDVDETFQEDRSMVKWYRKTGTGAEFELVYTFNDFDNNFAETFHEIAYEGKITTSLPNANSGLAPKSVVDKTLLVEGQEWYCIVTPYDTIDQGTPANSPIALITTAIQPPSDGF
jgi:hypothetical protein